MFRRGMLRLGAIVLVATLSSCSSATGPVAPPAAPIQETGDGSLTIRTGQLEYTIPPDARGVGVAASLTNETDRLFYAHLGDLFGGGPEQTRLFAAGLDGYLERWDAQSWVDATHP